MSTRTKRYTSQAVNMPRANKQIRARQVRLVDQDGNQVGVISFQEALDAASKVNLDLVEVSPNADPPVCRLMDLGKYMYNKSKKERQARKAQVKTKVKEIRLRPKTAGHDRDFMVRDARKWLERGDKVKVRIRFRGRELSHPEVAKKQLDEIADLLSDVGAVEQRPAFEGRSMLMILGPAKSKA